MIIRKAMYGCGLYFFIKLAYNSPILCKFVTQNKENEYTRTLRHFMLQIGSRASMSTLLLKQYYQKW